MANFFSKIGVQTADHAKKHFDLSCQGLRTQDFFKMAPVYFYEMVPNSSISMDMSCFSRMLPLSKPAMCSSKIVNRAFFVPYRTVWKLFNYYETQTPYISATGNQSIISSVPVVSNLTLCKMFADDDIFSSVVTDSDYDFKFYDPDNHSTSSYKLTYKGRCAMDILNSLGLRLIFPFDEQSYVDGTFNFSLSALPILSYAKVWYDWFSNPNYVNRSSVGKLFESVVLNVEYSVQQMADLFEQIVDIQYQNDYFTTAWDNPSSPNTSTLYPSLSIPDASLPNATRKSVISTSIHNSGGSSSGTPVARDTSSSTGNVANLSQYIDDTLHHITDLVKRWQLVGSRVIDRYSATHGVQLSAEKLNRSIYLGKHDVIVNITDVTATTENSEADQNLGSLAGKGAASSSSKFSYDTDEFGLFIIVSFVDCRYTNPFGTNRMWQHINRFDFFHGDFELGPQAIRMDEIFSWQNDQGDFSPTGTQHYLAPYGAQSPNALPNSVFGFTGRYGEYKAPFDNIGGDILLRRYWNDYSRWFMFRDLDDMWPQDGVIKHSLQFTTANGSQFNKIFADESSNTDHFITQYTFRVNAMLPMKPLFDTYEFCDDDKHVRKTMNLGGTLLND